MILSEFSLGNLSAYNVHTSQTRLLRNRFFFVKYFFYISRGTIFLAEENIKPIICIFFLINLHLQEVKAFLAH